RRSWCKSLRKIGSVATATIRTLSRSAARRQTTATRRGKRPESESGRSDNFPRLWFLVRQAKPGKGGRDVSAISETFRGSPAGNQPRPAEVGHQPEPSVAWWRSDPRCEAYRGRVPAAGVSRER